MKYITVGKNKLQINFVKKIRLIYLALGWVMIPLGIITFPFGGWLFSILGFIFLFKSRKYSKALKTATLEENTNSKTKDYESKSHIPPANSKKQSIKNSVVFDPESNIKVNHSTNICHREEEKHIEHSVCKNNSNHSTRNEIDTLPSENHQIAGVYYHRYAIEQLLDDYDKDLNIGKTISVGTPSVEPEPYNIYDSNAIKVLIDDYHIGYIKKGSCKHVLQLINANHIHHLVATIYRGDDDPSGDPSFAVTLRVYLLDN